MKIEITPNKTRTNRAGIESFAAEIGASLPAAYADFLLKYNGGKPEPNVVGPGGATAKPGVSVFFGLAEGHDDDLRNQREIFLGRMPDSFLPVADAPGGNLFCLHLGTGAVYLWDHEEEAGEDEEVEMENMTKLADSFTDFLAKLEKFSPDSVKLDPKAVKSAWINPKFLKQHSR